MNRWLQIIEKERVPQTGSREYFINYVLSDKKVPTIYKVTTYESVYPFRKITIRVNTKGKPIDEVAWILPNGIDNLVSVMERARHEKDWETADRIRKSLTEIGIVVRSGKDWYPKIIEDDLLAWKTINAWTYSMLSSSDKEKALEWKNWSEDELKHKYDI